MGNLGPEAKRAKHEDLLFLREAILGNPIRSGIILVSLLLAGLAEGLGVATVLPLMSFATDGGAGDSYLSRLVTDLLGVVGLQPSMGLLLSILVLGILLKAGMVLVAMRQVGYAVSQIATDFRLQVVREVSQANWQFFVNRPVGSFGNAVTQESSRASLLYFSAFRMCATFLQALVYMGLAVLVSWTVTVAAVGVGILMFWMLRFLVRRARGAAQAQAKHFETLAVRLTDSLAGIKPIKAMGWENRLVPLLEREAEGLNKATRSMVLSVEALRALQEPLMVVFLAIGLFIALVPLHLEAGMVMMMALLFYRSVMRAADIQLAYQGISSNYRFYSQIQAKIDAAHAAKEVFPGTGAQRFAQQIEVRSVTFAYADQTVLRDVNIEIPFGKMVTLSGPSGSGKTTTVDLICGLLRPGVGEIFIDGRPLSSLDIKQWRRQIGYVPQELTLLHDTILANVTLADPEFTRADAENALREAGVWDYVSALPAGMDTIAGERGMSMSGGQRQRIAIARALVRKPRLLILDEATTALDPATAKAICETLRGLAGETTVLAISHQAELVEMADTVYRFAGGRVRRSMAAVEQPDAAAV